MAAQRNEIEALALELSASERSALARRLIESLESGEAGDFEDESIEEAERRYVEYRRGALVARPAEDALRDARTRLQ